MVTSGDLGGIGSDQKVAGFVQVEVQPDDWPDD